MKIAEQFTTQIEQEIATRQQEIVELQSMIDRLRGTGAGPTKARGASVPRNGAANVVAPTKRGAVGDSAALACVLGLLVCRRGRTRAEMEDLTMRGHGPEMWGRAAAALDQLVAEEKVKILVRDDRHDRYVLADGWLDLDAKVLAITYAAGASGASLDDLGDCFPPSYREDIKRCAGRLRYKGFVESVGRTRSARNVLTSEGRQGLEQIVGGADVS